MPNRLLMSTPAGDGAHLVDGFHDWLHETSAPQALLAALSEVFHGTPAGGAGAAARRA